MKTWSIKVILFIVQQKSIVLHLSFGKYYTFKYREQQGGPPVG